MESAFFVWLGNYINGLEISSYMESSVRSVPDWILVYILHCAIGILCHIYGQISSVSMWESLPHLF